MEPRDHSVRKLPGSTMTPLMFHSGSISLVKDSVKPSNAAKQESPHGEIIRMCTARKDKRRTELRRVIERETLVRAIPADGGYVQNTAAMPGRVDVSKKLD